MRGHLVRLVAILAVFAFAGMASADETFRATLLGDNEVPPVSTDTGGSFKIQFSKDKSKAEYRLVVLEGKRVIQAHLHCAPEGVNGPVVVFLAGRHDNGWDVDGKWIDNATITEENIVNPACGTTLSQLAENIRDGNVYVNVHTQANPAGEVRGQVE